MRCCLVMLSKCLVLLALAFIASDLTAQAAPAPVLGAVPGQNINMVSGTGFPGGDPYLQRQNESSMAVSTRNPQHLLAGANDYRSVDIPFPPDNQNGIEKETGDAWLGVFTSLDGGQTWSSTLLPGYPQDQSGVGVSSPLHEFAVATDPTVRAGTHGLFYYSGLVFARGNNAPSGVFVATFQDQNNKGNGNGAIQQDKQGSGSPFLYRNATLVDTGTSGQFLDKPWIVVDVPRSGANANCTDANGKSFISGNVYVFYTSFNGSSKNPSSAINVVSSNNCGATWTKPTKISQSAQLNQGTVAALDPGTGTVYVFWRQIGNGGQNQPDAILYAYSTNNGGTWTTQTAYTFTSGSSFDESSDQPQTFREADLPTATVDGTGRVWLAFSQRNLGPLNTSRILVTTLPRGGSQKSWTKPFIADNYANPGHQFMPAFAFAYGKLMLIWFDNREDHTKGVLQCPQNTSCKGVSDFVETRVPLTGSGGATDSPSQIFGSTISDSGLHVRHTIDVRGALVDPTPFDNGSVSMLAFPSVRISQYTFGSRPCQDGSNPCTNPIEQLKFNPPNFPMFSHGTKPFIGDYIDVAALTILFDQPSRKWIFNTQPSNAAVFHATWTDNRDVRPPPVTCNGTPQVCTQNWALYTAVGSTGGTSFYDPTQMKQVCVPGTNDNQTGSRNQNVYTSRITQGLLVGVKENTKPLTKPSGASIQRTFSVFARNTTNSTAYYRFIVNPINQQNLCTTDASGTTSSFFQTIPPAPFSCVNFVDVIALPRSTVSRSLFVNSTLKYPSISVTVARIDQIGGPITTPQNGGLQSTTAINPDNTNPDITNPDITNPDITNPDITNPDITNPDITNFEVYDPTVTNPDITNPDITNPDITNPDITNPDITNPDITNPDITNVVVTNPDITNPDITNPDITNPDITNPDITNPDITSLSAGGATDVTFKLTNKGNTSASYSAKEFAKQVGVQCAPLGSTKCQLIVRKTYPTPMANACTLTVETQNIPISNVPNPAFVSGNGTTSISPDNGSDTQGSQPDPTVSVGPGEGVRVTLRVFGPVDKPQTGGSPVKTVGVAGGADTGQTTPATSLAITTIALPVAVVGTDYKTNSGSVSRLTSVGGFGATSWSAIAGMLPSGVSLATSGQLSGVVTAGPGAYPLTFRVDDSQTPTTNFDLQNLTIDVNKFSITKITAANTNISKTIYLKSGDSANVTVTVSNQGPADATSVAATLQPHPVVDGTQADRTPPVIVCQPVATPSTATLLGGNTTQDFIFSCNAGAGNGEVTFTATASAQYINPAATVSASAITTDATDVSQDQLVVDNVPPTLMFNSADPSANPAGWNNTSVSFAYMTKDNLSGVASNLPASPVVINVEGSGLTRTVVVTDRAGNSASFTTAPAVNIDFTSPQLAVVASTPGGAYKADTWTNQSVTVVFTCNDTFSPLANSGVISPAYPAVANIPQGAQVSSTQNSPTLASTTVVLTAETAGTTLTATCSDVATNATSPPTGLSFGPIMIDKTAPVVTGSATVGPDNTPYIAGTWTKQSPVTVTFGCIDTLSGAKPNSTTGNTVLAGPTQNKNVQGSCMDNAGNTGNGSFGPVLIDQLAPALVITSPAPAQTFVLNSQITPVFTCDDGGGGDVVMCNVTPSGTPYAASPVGPRTFGVSAVDQAGNVANASSNYTVIYNFSGFQSPLQPAGSATQPSNSGSFAQGSPIAFQWTLQDANGAFIADQSSLMNVTAYPNSACSGAPDPNGTPITLFISGTPPDPNSYQLNNNVFDFTWNTSGVASGCYNVAVTLNDGTQHVTIVNVVTISFIGQVADPTGDAGGGPDLTSATVTTLSDGTVKLSVRFAPGTLDSTTAQAEFLIDTDQKVATGSPGSNAGCIDDAATLGTDYLVVLSSGFANNQASIYKATGGCNQFVLLGNTQVTISANGMDASFPLSILTGATSGAATVGPWSFKVTDDFSLGGGSFSGLVDTMPDVGQNPGVTAPQQ